jgi:hypothetical protein
MPWAVQARKRLLDNELGLIYSVTPDSAGHEVKCANNIGFNVFAANPFVSRETTSSPQDCGKKNINRTLALLHQLIVI